MAKSKKTPTASTLSTNPQDPPTTVNGPLLNYTGEVPMFDGTERTLIVAANEGWVFVGKCRFEPDGSVVLMGAKNIRRWGTSKGLGELVNGPLSDTVYDEYGLVKIFEPIFVMEINSGW